MSPYDKSSLHGPAPSQVSTIGEQTEKPAPLVNPLWAINIGMAVFFLAAGFIMLFD